MTLETFSNTWIFLAMVIDMGKKPDPLQPYT